MPITSGHKFVFKIFKIILINENNYCQNVDSMQFDGLIETKLKWQCEKITVLNKHS